MKIDLSKQFPVFWANWIAAFTAISFFGIGCIPEKPVSPATKVPLIQKVIVEAESIPSPYPRDNGEIPAGYVGAWDCNFIQFLRYRPWTPDGLPKPVNAVLVLIPGYLGGANSFEYQARQLVSMAEANDSTGSLEVWAIDRRGNCLEDLTGLNAAETAGDPEIAVNYFYNGLTVAGHTFEGFLKSDDAPYLSEFGLRLLMNDIYTIITAKVPSQIDRKAKIIIGGHSMGGSFASFFAGWDFDGDAGTLTDSGSNNCAGLIGLDGRVGPRSLSSLSEEEYLKRLSDIRSGKTSRFNLFGIDTIGGVTPEALALFEILGMYANMYPKDEGNWFKDVPYSNDVTNMLKLLHSKDLLHYLTGTPAFENYRYTNEALLCVLFDDNFNPAPFMQVSMGFIYGGSTGTVMKKTFPGELAEMLGMGEMVTNKGMFIAGNPNGPLYEWVNFDEVGNASNPEYKDTLGLITYTTWMDEVSDIHDVALSLYNGPANFPEWYFTSRISLDSSAATAPYNSTYGLDFLHGDQIQYLPMLNIYASDHVGYNHLDVLFAAVDRPGHRENEVFQPMLDFIFGLVDNSTITIPIP